MCDVNKLFPEPSALFFTTKTSPHAYSGLPLKNVHDFFLWTPCNFISLSQKITNDGDKKKGLIIFTKFQVPRYPFTLDLDLSIGL